jgi:enoyl-CoA hydratase/carnithine racemase
MDTQDLTYIEASQEQRILVLRLNNPPNNYLPSQFFVDLNACRNRMLSEEVDAVIFTGRARTFSKGADIQEIQRLPGAVNLDSVLYANEMFSFIQELQKPVIAAINGTCLGGGLELALACHLRLCSEKAILGLPEVSIGVVPGLGGIQRLIRVIGPAKALEMILMGDMISAPQALALNLVNRVFPKDGFWDHVLVFVKTLLSVRKEAIQQVLRLFQLSISEDEARNIREAAICFSQLIPQPLNRIT